MAKTSDKSLTAAVDAAPPARIYLGAWLQALNIRPSRLAQLTGYDKSFISGLVNGDKWVSDKSLGRIAAALGIRPAALFIDIGTPDGRMWAAAMGYLKER